MSPASAPLRRYVQCLDGQRIPLNQEERSAIKGNVPYWGANGVVDHIDRALFDEDLILLGEDGAPFDDPLADVAHRVNEPVWVNNHIHVLRPRPGSNPRFITYALNSVDWMPFITGSTRLKLTQDDMLRVPIPVLDAGSQQAIVDFLDDDTTRIDALIAKKTKLVQAVEERFRSVVDESVNIWALNAPDPEVMLPSGWRFLMMRRCFSSIQYGIGEATRDTGAFPVLGMGNVDDWGGVVVDETGGFVEEVDSALLLRPGDLLFNRTNSLAKVGKVGLVRALRAPTTYASYLVRLRVNQLAEAAYLNYVLNAADFLKLARSVALPSIGQANLNPARYTELRVPLPPIGRQREIVNKLDKERSYLDALRSRVGRQIGLLKERRQALITAAVTGEMEVPGVA